ncbi:unnamed protein product [Pleuronectes platessa]|uniref:Uncharacterized protein n=1 Tax=Pleuronectes platessa TaxID=8262 RepID=A0A9N7Z5N0_PLEPL|nr:unnamed protein product [Pleuronectes platessa]
MSHLASFVSLSRRRVPPAGDVAEVIRETGLTRVQIHCRQPPYPVPSNRSPPSAPPTDTAPRPKSTEAPRTSEAVRHRGRGPPPKRTSRRAAQRASGGMERRATG